MTIATGDNRADTEASEEEGVHGGEMGSEAIRYKFNEVGKFVNIQAAGTRMTTTVRPSQPVQEFCPPQKKHFFCGIAKKLGCQFCAPK